MELAIWEIPSEPENREELPAVIDACEQRWREHIFSKVAVPEARFDRMSNERQILIVFAYGRSLSITPPLCAPLPTSKRKYWQPSSLDAACSPILLSVLTVYSCL